MKYGICVAAATWAVALATPSNAQSYRHGAFDGFYAGVGGSWERYDTEIELFSVDIDDDLDHPFDVSGIKAGRIFGGIGFQNKFLYGGIEGFASFTGAKIEENFDTADYPGVFDPATNGSSVASINANYSLGGSARVGAFMTPRFMVFIKGTATSTSFEAAASGAVLNGTIFQDQEVTAKENVTAFGYGAGIEAALSDRFFARVDYDHLFYSDFEIETPYFRIEPDYTSVTLGVGVRF